MKKDFGYCTKTLSQAFFPFNPGTGFQFANDSQSRHLILDKT